MSRSDERYRPDFRDRPKRHDPMESMRAAIKEAVIHKDGADVTLRFRNGTFVSFTPMPEQYLPLVERKLARDRS